MNTLLYEVLETDLHRVLRTGNSVWSLALRLLTAITVLSHGAQKLFADFGGFGIERLWQWLATIGLAPGFPLALIPGSMELICGLAILLGLLTRAAALVLGGMVILAMVFVRVNNDLSLAAGFGFELALLAVSGVLAVSGAGAISLDRFLWGRRAFV